MSQQINPPDHSTGQLSWAQGWAILYFCKASTQSPGQSSKGCAIYTCCPWCIGFEPTLIEKVSKSLNSLYKFNQEQGVSTLIISIYNCSLKTRAGLSSPPTPQGRDRCFTTHIIRLSGQEVGQSSAVFLPARRDSNLHQFKKQANSNSLV